MELMQASNQWANRPDDERFTSLPAMLDMAVAAKQHSHATVIANRNLEAVPVEGNTKGMMVVVNQDIATTPTHWSFSQLADRADAPASYLRTIPSPIAADCINYGLRFARDVEEVGVLWQDGGPAELHAVTGPKYGRVWNADVIRALVDRFGDGVTGQWRVPGIFGQAVDIDKRNTTLYASDRDMFVFLADEENRVELPDRRGGEKGSLARGFFTWNSEVGSSTFGVGFFLFDYVCGNRIVWGAQQYQEVRIRHTAGAPARFLEEMQPALTAFAQSQEGVIINVIEEARKAKIDSVDDFLANRFGKRAVPALQAIHQAEEGRPIETVWDAVTAVTARARSIGYQNERVDLERKAGELLALAA